MSRDELAADVARRKAAYAEERARAEAAKAAQPPPQQAQEWLRQNNIANVGLLVAAL